MKNKTVTAVLLAIGLTLASEASAQHAAKSVFVELGGPGLASINFDTRFTKKEGGIGGRAGIGYFSIVGERLLLVPVGVNYLLSKDQRHYFEVGGGITVVDYKSEFYYEDDSRFTGTFGHLNFGYRFQPKGGGFTFRAAINPVFTGEGFFPYYGGISFGYAF
ncbi:MAG: hypothetical protein EOO16_03615 [Chitinophagaceae bacterium]|nr:MAG: hypothetical protein EOO16_03615 [Chitinophagaceae bacterium]